MPSFRIAEIEPVLMNAAIGERQKPFLTDAQIASSRAIMGLDTQLINNGTYLIVEQDGVVAGCGGWSHLVAWIRQASSRIRHL
jgi:hypothetical protein